MAKIFTNSLCTLVLFILVLLGIYGCRSTSSKKQQLSSEMVLPPPSTEHQEDTQTDEERFLQSRPSLTQFTDRFPSQPILKQFDCYYTIMSVGGHSEFVSFLSDQSFNLHINLDFSKGINGSAMREICKGDSFDRIKQIDPNGAYTFLYTGYSQPTKFSYHYVKGDGLYQVFYDEDYIVTGVTYFSEET